MDQKEKKVSRIRLRLSHHDFLSIEGDQKKNVENSLVKC
jgi:hypothetical protein